MSFFESIPASPRKYADVTGRADRPEFWWFVFHGDRLGGALGGEEQRGWVKRFGRARLGAYLAVVHTGRVRAGDEVTVVHVPQTTDTVVCVYRDPE